MTTHFERDAVVVGAGPNGLAAAITLAREGYSVLLREAAETAGGGMRSAELTLPGFVHDVCSAIHPLAAGSPFFRNLPLREHGLDWIHPALPLAHPLDADRVGVLDRSILLTGASLGADATAYEHLFEPLATRGEEILDAILGPLLRVPRHPLALARFGIPALRSIEVLARAEFAEEPARALLAGLAAHSFLPLSRPGTAAFALVLGMLGHVAGWPFPRGGSQRIADAMASHLHELGGEVMVGAPVKSLAELPRSRVVLLDITPRQLLRIAGGRLPLEYARRLERYRYGPGVFKIDYALAGPNPWRAADGRRAGTVHLGGTLDEIVRGEESVARGEHPEKPFVLLAQQSLFDPSRAPEGKHTAWAYCHVPNGSTVDMTSRIEGQIERFAPGFRDLVLARHTMSAAALERYNANYVGGDISGGVQDLWQTIARPALRRIPYATPIEGIYLCSSSTPPGGGVHGMCGFHAARAAIAAVLRK